MADREFLEAFGQMDLCEGGTPPIKYVRTCQNLCRNMPEHPNEHRYTGLGRIILAHISPHIPRDEDGEAVPGINVASVESKVLETMTRDDKDFIYEFAKDFDCIVEV